MQIDTLSKTLFKHHSPKENNAKRKYSECQKQCHVVNQGATRKQNMSWLHALFL